MTEQLIITMFELVEMFSQKDTLSESEFCAYEKGLEFVETCYSLNSRVIKDEMNDDSDRDTEQYISEDS